jgi:hypothetical protein
MNAATGRGIGIGGNRLRPWVWGGAVALLALPGVAMRLHVEGVDWDATDFLVFGTMLVVACGLYELATRMSGDIRYRAAAGIAVATGFLTVWANLAVGMIGNEGNRFNLLFGGVLAIALAGALLAKLRAPGMAKAMLAAGVAQALVVAAAFVGGWDMRGAVFSALFVAPWLLSAALFRASARKGIAGA